MSSQREVCINLALMGWEPIPSSSGLYLYWKKGESYDHPYAHMMFDACSLFDTHAGQYWFEQEVELRRKQIMSEFPNEDVATVVRRQLEEKQKEQEQKEAIKVSKRKSDEKAYNALTRLKDNCLQSLGTLKGLTVHKTVGTVTFHDREETLHLYVKYETWEIGSDEKPVEVEGWRLTCKANSYEVYSISDINNSGKFIQELGKYVAERLKV